MENEAIPQKIGRYQILSKLGQGAMGVVYKATDPNIGRTVALKTTRLDLHDVNAEEVLTRFRNEARLAGVLKHPNIVTIYDAGEHAGLFYIAMEYIEGRSLQQVLNEKRLLPVEQAVDIARQIAAGLDCAAANRVVHRDIKPANIMIQPDGTVKITDFGIAKAGASVTTTGQVLGTPYYMSPEQVKGHVLDGRSDLFSLGVILYELLTGSKPFDGDNVTTIIYKIINENPLPPVEHVPALPAVLSAMTLKLLAKIPENRYQKGANVARDLIFFKSNPTEGTVTLRVPSQQQLGEPGRPATQAAPTHNGVKANAPSHTSDVAVPPSSGGAVVESVPSPPPSPREQVSPIEKIYATYGNWIRLGAIGLAAIVVLFIVMAVVGRSRQHSDVQQHAELEQLLNKPQPTLQPAQPQPAPVEATPSATAPAAEVPRAATPRTRPQPQPAAQPAAPAIPPGTLVLHTTPEGADIQIDGSSDPSWHTPYTADKLTPGAHTVIFTLTGYTHENRLVNVKSGQTAYLGATLNPTPTAVNISSDPAGAAVIVDGADTGKITPAHVTLSGGDHALLLRKAGYQDLQTTAHITAGQASNFTLVLQPAAKQSNMSKFKGVFTGGNKKVPVQVRTNPPGAQVLVDGVPQGHTTPTRLNLEPGDYDISFQIDGYKSLHRNLTVQDGVPLEITETLQPR